MLGTNCQTGHPLDKYDVLDTLGTGGFAVVKRVRSKMTGENFAMKIINVTFDPVRASPPPDAPRIRRFDKTPNRTLTVFFATGCSLSRVFSDAVARA
jgi:serine/threonine protein kinase